MEMCGRQNKCWCTFFVSSSAPSSARALGSISAVSRVFSWSFPKREGMSAGSFSRTAAGNRAYAGPDRILIESKQFINLKSCLRVAIQLVKTFNAHLLASYR